MSDNPLPRLSSGQLALVTQTTKGFRDFPKHLPCVGTVLYGLFTCPWHESVRWSW